MVFADWRKDDQAWYTRAELADLLDCSENSLPSAFTYLRQHGYVVDNRRVTTDKINLHRIQRMDLKTLKQLVRRPRAAMKETKSTLTAKVKRGLHHNVIPMKRAA